MINKLAQLEILKPSLVYAILIALVVVAASLYARSNNPIPGNQGSSNKSSADESVMQETGAEIKSETIEKSIETTGKNASEKE